MEHSKKKVLIIDDSALMRRVMSDIIDSDQRLTAEDVAKNGLEGLELIDQGKKYDLILLDINMPRMNGVAFLEELLKRKDSTKVLVVSSIASKSANETIRALELGAFDFVRKPDRLSNSKDIEFNQILLTKAIMAVLPEIFVNESVDWEQLEEISHNEASEEQEIVKQVQKDSGERLVVIASSTGGPRALQQILPEFQSNFDYPIVVVQHMPEGFTGSLARRLNEMCKLPVCEMEDGMMMEGGKIYLAKGGYQCYIMQVGKNQYSFSLTQDDARNGLKPCADLLLESLAESTFGEIVCCILTGMGDDGSRGLVHLRKYKNISVVAQDEQSCVVYGMPRAAKAAGVVDQNISIDYLTDTVMRMLN